jgi:Lrp/AsnC family transcriptional regulator for asnA, asnC and gidA
MRRHHGRSPLSIDDIDRAIIEQLQQDGRRPYGRIGEAVGLSEAAVRQRVQRLTDSGLVRIVAVTDPLLFGTTMRATIGVRADGDLMAVADAIAELAEVDYLVITAGSFDLLVEVVCEDDSHLLSVVQALRATAGVRETETFIYLKLHKQTYTWPPTEPAADAG